MAVKGAPNATRFRGSLLVCIATAGSMLAAPLAGQQTYRVTQRADFHSKSASREIIGSLLPGWTGRGVLNDDGFVEIDLSGWIRTDVVTERRSEQYPLVITGSATALLLDSPSGNTIAELDSSTVMTRVEDAGEWVRVARDGQVPQSSLEPVDNPESGAPEEAGPPAPQTTGPDTDSAPPRLDVRPPRIRVDTSDTGRIRVAPLDSATFESVDSSVATVDHEGVVTGVEYGETWVRVRVGNAVDSIEVHVRASAGILSGVAGLLARAGWVGLLVVVLALGLTGGWLVGRRAKTGPTAPAPETAGTTRAIRVRHAMLTHVGGRDTNQDRIDTAKVGETTCWVLADGLGGHRGGEVAAEAAVKTALQSFRTDPEFSPSAIGRHIDAAQQIVRQHIEHRPELESMRSTLVLLLHYRDMILWGHVGDSRLYHFRNGRVRFHTRDHSVPQALVDAGEIAPADVRSHEDRNRITKALGQFEPLKPSVAGAPEELERGDALLLCTDGYWEHVTEPEMEATLSTVRDAEHWLRTGEEIVRNRVSGSHDNYSAIGIFVS